MTDRPRPGRRGAVVLALALLAGSLVSCTAVSRVGAAPLPRCSEPLEDIFERVSPAVVYIVAKSINPFQLSDRVVRVAGSGVIFDASGLIVTNAHVAYGRQSISVILDDGTVLPAELAGADLIFDLAVLRIPPPVGGTLPVAVLGDSDRLRVGQDVIAIGNPLGLDQSLTRGVVSAINRILSETPFSVLEPLIQTDTPINPGNSGGPLLDRCGEIIGINTSVIPDAQSIGFAIPISLVKTVLPSLIDEGRVIRPWLGFHGQIVGEVLQQFLKIPLVDGLLIEVVEPGSPAERAGLRGGRLEFALGGREILIGGDIITSINGIRLDAPESLVEVIRTLKVGSTVRLTVFRNGDYQVVEYALPERPVLPGDLPGQRPLAPLTGRPARGAPTPWVR